MAIAYNCSYAMSIFFMALITVANTIAANNLTEASTANAVKPVKHYVDCERQCPFYYMPICATNGNEMENRMFVNVCEMLAHNCDANRKFRRTRNNKCKDYHEYVDDAWLNSIKPPKMKYAENRSRVLLGKWQYHKYNTNNKFV